MKIIPDLDADTAWEGIGQPIIFWVVALVIVIGTLAYLGNKYISCPAFGRAIQKPTFYSFWAGDCYVELGNNVIVSQENYGAVNLENK